MTFGLFFCDIDKCLLQFEFVTDSQHTTIVVPLDTAIFVQLGQRSRSTQVEGNAVGKFVRETKGNSEVKGIAVVLEIIAASLSGY